MGRSDNPGLTEKRRSDVSSGEQDGQEEHDPEHGAVVRGRIALGVSAPRQSRSWITMRPT